MKPVDYVIFILCAILAAMIVPLGVMIGLGYIEHNIDRAKVIGGIISSLVAIISIYVGAKIKERE